MARAGQDVAANRQKEIAVRVTQLGVELAADLLHLNAAGSFINCAVDVWRIATKPKQEELAAALLREFPDLESRLHEMQGRGANALRPDELELIATGMASLSPSATTERVQKMCKLISSGLDADTVAVSRAKRLARLLGELDDEHLLVLMHYDTSASSERRAEIAIQNPQLFPPPPLKPDILQRLEASKLGLPFESAPKKKLTEAELGEQAQQQMHLKLCCEHLQSVGLLNYRATEDGPDTRFYALSRAGYEFLNAIGLLANARTSSKPWW